MATANEGDVTSFDKRHGTASPSLGHLLSFGVESCMRMPIYEHNMIPRGEKCVKLRIIPHCLEQYLENWQQENWTVCPPPKRVVALSAAGDRKRGWPRLQSKQVAVCKRRGSAE